MKLEHRCKSLITNVSGLQKAINYTIRVIVRNVFKAISSLYICQEILFFVSSRSEIFSLISFKDSSISTIIGFDFERFLNSSSRKPSLVSIYPSKSEKNTNRISAIGTEIIAYLNISPPKCPSLKSLRNTYPIKKN